MRCAKLALLPILEIPRAMQDFDASAAESFDSLHALHADMRARCPVGHTDALGGFWALFRHADILSALQQPARYITSVQNVVPRVAFTGRRPPLHFDPPEHTPYRAALNPLLSAEKVARLEPAIARICTELMQPLVKRGHADICEDYASYLSVQVFGHWMQLPPAMVQVLREAGQAFVMAVRSAQPDSMKRTSLALYDMARELIALRQREPLDVELDPTSALLAARDANGQPFPAEMVVGTVRQVLVVGIVAPTVFLGSVCVHLCRHPELQQQLRNDPSLLSAAVEEFLRLYTPYRGFARTATEDVAIGGRPIKAKEPIALVYASANRDEAVFERSDEFILHRPNIAQHIAFGHGAHYCAGAALARLEMRVALEVLLAQTQSFSAAGEPEPAPYPEAGTLSVPLHLFPHLV
jgi:cytochrome P450